MLRVTDLSKSFDGFMAVRSANLTVEKGEIVAVIGPNGAGKTTLFNVITGQLKPESGEVLFKERPITGLPPHVICRKGISRSFQIVNIFPRLTVFENVQVALLSREGKQMTLWSSSRRLVRKETREILTSIGLWDKADFVCATLSHGEQKVLEMGIALGTRPELLILDEPTAGMSPEETAATLSLMSNLSRQLGLTLLFCEHDMDLVFSFAHRIMVMHQGATIIQDKPEAVKADLRVQEAYLGTGGR